MSQHPLKQGDGLVHLPEFCFCLLELGDNRLVGGGTDPRETQTSTKAECRVGKAGECHGWGVVQGLCLPGWVPQMLSSLPTSTPFSSTISGVFFSQSGQSLRTQESGEEQVRLPGCTLQGNPTPGLLENGQSRHGPHSSFPVPSWLTQGSCLEGSCLYMPRHVGRHVPTARWAARSLAGRQGTWFWVCLSSPCHAPAQQVSTYSEA